MLRHNNSKFNSKNAFVSCVLVKTKQILVPGNEDIYQGFDRTTVPAVQGLYLEFTD